MLKAKLEPGFIGCGKSIRIMVLLIVWRSGWPSSPLTDASLKPPSKLRLSRLKRIASNFKPSASLFAAPHASRDGTVAMRRLSESARNMFWSSCTHR